MENRKGSEDLKNFMEWNSIKTIEKLVVLPNEKYYTMIGFTYHILTEILEIKETFSIQNTIN